MTILPVAGVRTHINTKNLCFPSLILLNDIHMKANNRMTSHYYGTRIYKQKCIECLARRFGFVSVTNMSSDTENASLIGSMKHTLQALYDMRASTNGNMNDCIEVEVCIRCLKCRRGIC